MAHIILVYYEISISVGINFIFISWLCFFQNCLTFNWMYSKFEVLIFFLVQ